MQSGGQVSGLISSVPRFLIIGVLLIVAFVVLYYSYNFLFNNLGFPSGSVLTTGIVDATVPYKGSVPSVQLPYEGGDYTISFWLYVNSNTFISNQYRKHIFDIGGTNFSTVAIGIDAGENSLIVRTHTGMVPPVGSRTGSGSGSGSQQNGHGGHGLSSGVSDFCSGCWLINYFTSIPC